MADAVTDYVMRESGRILQGVIARDTFPTSPWLTLVKRAVWPMAMGEDLNVITTERSAPDVAQPTWTQIATVDGAEGGQCLPATTKIPLGSTKRTFYLYRVAVEGPDFCAVDLHAANQLGPYLTNLADVLGDYVRIMWEMQDRQEYFKMCYRKVLVNACPPVEDATMAADWDTVASNQSSNTCTFSILTQGILNRYRPVLIRDGAAKSALGMKNGSPIMTLITSLETSDNIIFLNGDIRQDIRDGAPNKLLAPLGVVGDYRGFYHVHDPFPRRYTCATGDTSAAFTQVATFEMLSATKGRKAEVTSAWRTATLEESFIYDPDVFTQMVPQPVVNPAPGFTFDPVSYVGEIKTMNIPDRVVNPDGTILYHRAIMAAASMPYKPQRGVAFLHLRCDPACNLVTACTT